MEGTIFNIQKFCINDGPGIRTTVFLKGCPLNCLWCHNPESKAAAAEIFYDPKKCILCGKCAEVCPEGRHHFTQGTHAFDRTDCIRCGECAKECAAGALEKVGRTVTVQEVIADVMKDAVFYKNSGGGMTLSGGEPMAQVDFALALLTAAKEQGLHTCMETCGFSTWENYQKVMGSVDIFLFDYKLTDPEAHKNYTGVSNGRILRNLELLDQAGAGIILRCPIIPNINDTPAHFSGIAQTANRLKHVLEINIEPYHPLGSSKAAMLGKSYQLDDLQFPENEVVDSWIRTVSEMTEVPVRKA